jgi:uncharacterized protein
MIRRAQSSELAQRLLEPRNFIQVIAGARQVGKTTMVDQTLEDLNLPAHVASADEPTLRGSGWLEEQWQIGRALAEQAGPEGAILVIDEIQKAANWAEGVKRLWDADTRAKTKLKVVLLGSAPLLIQSGLTESLAGRFETIHLPHWSFQEMQQGFDFTLDQYLYFGAYPGAATLINQPKRWTHYILHSLIETTISRDVLLLSRVDKPALLRRLFQLGCSYSGQVLSYTKMLGQLQERGNTTTLAHYLELLASAGMLTGLSKYSPRLVRKRGSSPKLQVFNTCLMTAQSGMTLAQAKKDTEYWGHLVESAVGAHLINAAAAGECEVYYWRDRNREVDFVLRHANKVTAIEVKSGQRRDTLPGMTAFAAAHGDVKRLLVGADGIPLETFLSSPVSTWL